MSCCESVNSCQGNKQPIGRVCGAKAVLLGALESMGANKWKGKFVLFTDASGVH